jgi:hypothetical protein
MKSINSMDGVGVRLQSVMTYTYIGRRRSSLGWI